MTALAAIIKDQIGRFGPISVADYMNLCLLHPDHGYYVTRDPLGRAGDFTTAPEISQMFGEMLGLCLAQCWQDQGRPTPFVLAEPGPGRGTLMADILRATSRVPGFTDAAHLWLIDVNPVLTEMQHDTLQDWSPNLTGKIADLPDLPLFLIANEFFDALPARQFIRGETGWQERMIGLKGGELSFGLASPLPVDTLEDQRQDTKPGDIVETCAPAQGIIGDIADRLARLGGAALIIDYGEWGTSGDTFQAVRSHQKTDPLACPGNADLTMHVDFAALGRAADNVVVTGLTDQGVLLERLGITARARVLADGLSGDALTSHIAAHRRLTHPDEMGHLFKAIAFHPTGTPPPPGFDR